MADFVFSHQVFSDKSVSHLTILKSFPTCMNNFFLWFFLPLQCHWGLSSRLGDENGHVNAHDKLLESNTCEWSLQLMTTVLKTDLEIATHVALHGGNQKDALRLRRQSAPLTRKKSSMSYLSARSDADTAPVIDVRLVYKRLACSAAVYPLDEFRVHDFIQNFAVH